LRHRIRTSITTAIVLALAWTMLAIAPVSAAGEKVVIIVGPTGGQTAGYRNTGDAIAATAQAAGATVVKVYSPNATWANIRAAVNGANIIVYLGHGNGYPNPYTSPPNSTAAGENTDRVNGWGVNKVAGGGGGGDDESNMVYCGEQALLGTLSSSNSRYPYCAGGITPAPGFVMVYNKACYTPGAGETGDANESMAFQRVRHFSYPAHRLGGSAYFATDLGNGASVIIDLILRYPNAPYGEIAASATGYDGAAQRRFPHPDLPGKEVWIQRTNAMGRMDYWYAFAGNPAASFANPGAPPAPVSSSLDVVRYAGSDRYATAAAVSAASFAVRPAVAFVATGANFPDALAGSAAAAVSNAPILLVTSTMIPTATANELARLQPGSIVVLGGSGVVSDAVLAGLDPFTNGPVHRIAGGNRFETAAAISASTFGSGVSVAYVATGSNFPDALAGTPAAGSQGGPVLLTGNTELPAATANELARLRPGRIVILGGSGVVSDAVANQLAAYTSGGVTRLAGGDRYSTAVAVTSATYSSADTVYIATGANFPDALAGGPVAGMTDMPLLLVPASGVPDVVRAELLRLNPSKVVILGSTGVVSDFVVSQLQALFP
jgi:putative cell wall-binding protein